MTAPTPVSPAPAGTPSRRILALLLMTAINTTALGFGAPAIAADVAGTVVSVDVHPGEARVTRLVPVPAAADAKNERTLVVGPLPRTVLPDSIEIEAGAGFTVLDVRHRRRQHDSAAALQVALDALARSRATNTAQQAEVQAQLAVLDRMGRFGAGPRADQASRSVRSSALDAEGLAQFTRDLFANRDVLVQRADELQRAAAGLQAQRAALLARQSADEMADVHEVVVRLAGGTTASELQLHYRVTGVRWEVAYEARARSSGDEFTLTQFASIAQASGEDWRDAELRLFSTPPHAAADASSVKSLRLALSRSPSAAVRSMPRQLVELLEPVVDGNARRDGRQHNEAAPAPRFRATVVATVLHDAAPRRVPLGTHSLDAMLLHVAQPLRGPDVFRRAALTNTTGRALPAGPVRVWMDGEAAGETTLAGVPAGTGFDVGLGVDPAVTASRVVVSREVSSRANRRIVTLKLALAVSSTSPRDVALEVADVMPTAPARSGIRITVLEVVPALRPADTGESGEQGRGRLHWEASLAPGQQWQAEYGFRVEYDAAFELGAWSGAAD